MKKKPSSSSSDKTYEVGHGRPPLRGRWQKGQSGNPLGPKKGNKSIKTMVTEVANEPIATKNANGKTKTISKLQGILTQLANKGVRGDTTAARVFLDLFEKYAQDPAALADSVPLSDDDWAILARLEKRDVPDDDSGSPLPQP